MGNSEEKNEKYPKSQETEKENEKENEEKYSEDDKKLLSQHVTNLDGSIYAIYNLPPEVIAVLFAYVSRSPAGFRDNLLQLLKGKELDIGNLLKKFDAVTGTDYEEAKKKAREFHEKWVVGYGHSSIAEHAVASIAVENVSIIASKIIEDNRLASYTEKSTRYQKYSRDKVIMPKKIMDSKFSVLYKNTINLLFDAYEEFLPILVEFVRKKYPKQEGMSDRAYDSITNARAFDIARYILPAATPTNLAMTANARVLEHAVTKLLSHELEEMREIGLKMKEEIKKVIPTLLKYADNNPYFAETDKVMNETAKNSLGNSEGKPEGNSQNKEDETRLIEKVKPVTLVDYDKDAYDKVAASVLYRYSNLPFSQIMESVKRMTLGEKEKVIDSYLGRMGKHDRPMREFEHVYYTFDILVDYGAFRDIQRHRIATQTNQLVTADHGYDVPKELEEISPNLVLKYVSVMEKAALAFFEISREMPLEAQYIVPFAFKKRVLFTWNLRELFYFIRLRSGKEGHISYRRIAWQLYEEIKKAHPVFAKYIQVNMEEGPSR